MYIIHVTSTFLAAGMYLRLAWPRSWSSNHWSSVMTSEQLFTVVVCLCRTSIQKAGVVAGLCCTKLRR